MKKIYQNKTTLSKEKMKKKPSPDQNSTIKSKYIDYINKNIEKRKQELTSLKDVRSQNKSKNTNLMNKSLNLQLKPKNKENSIIDRINIAENIRKPVNSKENQNYLNGIHKRIKSLGKNSSLDAELIGSQKNQTKLHFNNQIFNTNYVNIIKPDSREEIQFHHQTVEPNHRELFSNKNPKSNLKHKDNSSFNNSYIFINSDGNLKSESENLYTTLDDFRVNDRSLLKCMNEFSSMNQKLIPNRKIYDTTSIPDSIFFCDKRYKYILDENAILKNQLKDYVENEKCFKKSIEILKSVNMIYASIKVDKCFDKKHQNLIEECSKKMEYFNDSIRKMKSTFLNLIEMIKIIDSNELANNRFNDNLIARILEENRLLRMFKQPNYYVIKETTDKIVENLNNENEEEIIELDENFEDFLKKRSKVLESKFMEIDMNKTILSQSPKKRKINKKYHEKNFSMF